MFDLSLTLWFACIGIALLLGSSKGGLPGVGILVVPLLASIFPEKASTGILLTMLLSADVFAVAYYHRHADGDLLKRLLPPTFLGIVLGWAVMGRVDDAQLRAIIGWIILAMLALLIIKEIRGKHWEVSRHPVITFVVGVSVGITTMLANAAGPISALYLISMNMEKKEFIGTRAWFFLVVNAVKVPFSFSLGLITFDSLVFNLKCFPFIVAGVFIGIVLVKRISLALFNRLVMLIAGISALRMILGN